MIVQSPISSEQVMQYSFDWNNAALQVITTGLSEIPVVGGILSGLVNIFWYHPNVDIWAEIKDQVEALIDQQINQDDFNRVESILGSSSQQSGLIGVLATYLNDRSESNWHDANFQFIGAQGEFQQKGIELLLLPLFAQFANMHLSLLRDGATQNWGTAESDLPTRITDYTQWVQLYYQQGYAAKATANQGFNYLNQYIQGMQTSVLRYAETWQYFDPAKYPAPVTFHFTEETYFTITGALNMKGGNYNLPSIPDAPLTESNVYWLQDSYDNYNFVLGTQNNYGDGTNLPYTGVSNNQTPQLSTNCDPNNDYFCYFKQSVPISENNPIVAVNGSYNATGAVYFVDFVYKDGSSTGKIPNQNGTTMDYANSFTIGPPQGYYLSSIWVPPVAFYYGGAQDVVFGFRYNPPPLSQETARIVYTSSLDPVSLENPRFAPFAKIAQSHNWEGLRQQYLAGLKEISKS